MSDSTDTSMENILNSIKQIIAEDDENRLQVMKETEEYYKSQGKEMEDMSNVVPASAMASLSKSQDLDAPNQQDTNTANADLSPSSHDASSEKGSENLADSQVMQDNTQTIQESAVQENASMEDSTASLGGEDVFSLKEGEISPENNSLGKGADTDSFQGSSQKSGQEGGQDASRSSEGLSFEEGVSDNSMKASQDTTRQVSSEQSLHNKRANAEVDVPFDLGQVGGSSPVGENNLTEGTSPSGDDEDILDLGALSVEGSNAASVEGGGTFSSRHEDLLLHNAGSVDKVMETQGENRMNDSVNDFNNNASDVALDLGGVAAMDLGDPLDLSSVQATEPLDVSSSFRSEKEESVSPSGADSLLSQKAAMAGVSAFRELERSVRVGYAGETLEDVIKGLLRPMLQSWLDNNLPRIVEELVEQEIQNMVGSARGKR